MIAATTLAQQSVSAPRLAGAVVLSVAAHGLFLFAINAVRNFTPGPKNETVELQVFETVKVQPPEKPLEPPPEPTRKKPPVMAKAPPPPKPEPEPLPPPPNTEQPAEEKPAPVFVGISMSSTTTAGGFAAPVGNTLYGAAPKVAPMPEEVKPYSAKKYAPPHLVHELPTLANDCSVPKEMYPTEAKTLNIEGRVILRVGIDDDGQVVTVKVVRGVGYGLDEVAVEAIKTRCRFKPAKLNGEPVATEITYTFTFELE